MIGLSFIKRVRLIRLSSEMLETAIGLTCANEIYLFKFLVCVLVIFLKERKKL